MTTPLQTTPQTLALDWQPVCPDTFQLGESPFWHPQEQTLYWVDIPGQKLCRANVYMGTVDSWDMPCEPGCIAPATSGGLVIARRDGVFRAREWRGALELITTLPYDTAAVRANDGKCDALGRFWVGTIDEPKASMAGALYSIDCRGGRTPLVTQHAGDALTGNGLGWSPDGRTTYWSDTPNHVIHAWDFGVLANGLSAHRIFQQLPPKPADWQWDAPRGTNGLPAYRGRPDGAAVDVEGNYYAAMFEGQRICKFAPDGRLLAEIPVPAMCPTMPCLGGEDGKALYVTTARYKRSAAELAAFPLSGSVFSTRVDVPGLPVNAFAD
ncbi:SMP-30/gluconolactonase/LRE family protein [Rhodoferax sp. AJA081-3]|uniref:SMP-30/gluconolactonase/LRE family protein n=1 Tax=Rhodoferax sp. AJA081-3 TaxID=2752316 RepID=UPI001AE08594|nr:SMP-30/gluconolactonase/LRE family protein [Rhodoferax sp. AJA081-3]QTN26513.1 SMP-30/gluconolactonase/LRE family protein [Rhodoferax sp. AJA081-3]